MCLCIGSVKIPKMPVLLINSILETRGKVGLKMSRVLPQSKCQWVSEPAPESRLVAESVLLMAPPVSLKVSQLISYHTDRLSYFKSLKVFPNFVLIIAFSPLS